ncbi:PDR/VanB family oxidoreductase [Algihabitans albus]|uniref:PDR/VanB family oxidoreductase n=1 Tax=Algihabitans albus TaxID=2164067 RepID=UPI001ABC75DE|nr:PDR/VanB family oxidoreductase [Algihabitans albus]
MSHFDLVVESVRRDTPLIRSFVLSAADGEPLPEIDPGAHLRVVLPDGRDRPYSLVALPELEAAGKWALGVRLEDPGQGGSRYMHALAQGDRIRTSAPINNFPLSIGPASPVLIAGGIGVTPLVSMAAKLARHGKSFALHYAARSRDHFAFLEELRTICGDRLSLHPDDDPDLALDISALIASLQSETPIYVCGPAPMIDRVKAEAAARGRDPEKLRYELFTAPVADPQGDAAFQVELKSTGQVFDVPPGKSIIDVLESGGVDLLYDCQRGDCGVCQTVVLEGLPDHRDAVLSDAERASNKLMQICVSRAKSPKLVLDL